MASIVSTIENRECLLHNYSNMALLKADRYIIAGLSNRFESKELLSRYVGLSIKQSKYDFWGFTYEQYGFKEYLESQMGLAYARRLFKNLAISVQARYNRVRILNYGSAGNLSFSMGATGQLPSNIKYALYISSIETIDKDQYDRIDAQVYFGLAKEISKNAKMHLEITNTSFSIPTIRLAFELSISPQFDLYWGTDFGDTIVAWGFDFALKRYLNLSCGIRIADGLGWTPALSLSSSIKSLD